VDVEEVDISRDDDGYLLVVSRVHAYRRIDLLVRAATMLDRRLVVVGDGPEMPAIRRLAGPSVEFVGAKDRIEVREYMRRCHLYVVPGDEAFGMAPVEAMAAGKPVVAFAAGGALDTVVEGISGILFDEQTPAALAAAIERADTMTFDPAAIRAVAERFSASVFRARFVALFEQLGVDPALYVTPRT
jgi:glycosyltransferase involved in cell wall biosynthesis